MGALEEVEESTHETQIEGGCVNLGLMEVEGGFGSGFTGTGWWKRDVVMEDWG